MKQKTGYKKYKGSIILYGICALLCLLNITTLYPFFLIFVALTAFYVYMYNKHKADAPHPLYTFFKKQKEAKGNEKKVAKSVEEYKKEFSKKELRQLYNARLEQIEKDFDFDYGDDDDDDFDNE